MFDKILIANRGEIACRIIKSAHKMGVECVAVYSDADETALHVQMADQAVWIGAAPASESYLKGCKLIEVALETGAQAIHPGYGFLSEDAEFARKVAKAGLVFIGPTADVIERMGQKDRAKSLMANAGVPVVPGYHGADQDPAILLNHADDIGFPVLIKARSGGGGKGMRLVETRDQFETALAACQREAKASFGDDHVLIEKFITNPRHIEVQVFGDTHGNVVHLFERDCSMQRRYQKVIEEAPAPGMPDDVRHAMTQAAVKATKEIGYHGAGTMEFIADGSGALSADGFWFMEMNTRLQVEHPVTEAITGYDLVEWQLRVAAGEPLPVSQDAIAINGHAVELRIYAEDPSADFKPTPGPLKHLRFPSELRVDTGVSQGDQVTPFYDPMIAKLIAHSTNRQSAIDKLDSGLRNSLIDGTSSNLCFLRALINDAAFQAAQLDTGAIDRKLEGLINLKLDAFECAGLACFIAGVDPHHPLTGFRHFEKRAISVEVLAQDDPQEIRAELSAQHVIVSGDLGQGQVQSASLDGDRFTANFNAIARSAKYARIGNTIYIHSDRASFEVQLNDPLNVTRTDAVDTNTIFAPITGVVTALDAKVDQTVKEGAPLLFVEAMKMEHQITAPRDGKISQVTCTVGGSVAEGDILINFEAED